MNITLTEHDINKMSAELRKELMQFIFNMENEYNNYGDYTDEMDFEYESLLPIFRDESFSEDEPLNRSSKTKKSKNVIEIDKCQAKEMIANLNDKSIEILGLFTTQTPVPLTALVGVDKPYSTFVELKRSFVGPVNRRLRTVTGNRTAVLFLKVKEAGNDENIAVKQVTAEALKSVLKLNQRDENVK